MTNDWMLFSWFYANKSSFLFLLRTDPRQDPLLGPLLAELDALTAQQARLPQPPPPAPPTLPVYRRNSVPYDGNITRPSATFSQPNQGKCCFQGDSRSHRLIYITEVRKKLHATQSCWFARSLNDHSRTYSLSNQHLSTFQHPFNSEQFTFFIKASFPYDRFCFSNFLLSQFCFEGYFSNRDRTCHNCLSADRVSSSVLTIGNIFFPYFSFCLWLLFSWIICELWQPSFIGISCLTSRICSRSVATGLRCPNKFRCFFSVAASEDINALFITDQNRLFWRTTLIEHVVASWNSLKRNRVRVRARGKLDKRSLSPSFDWFFCLFSFLRSIVSFLHFERKTYLKANREAKWY